MPRGCLPGGGVCLPRGCLADTPPPVDRMTDTCKNITLDGKNNIQFMSPILLSGGASVIQIARVPLCYFRK